MVKGASSIINISLTIGVGLGFLCFATIALPDELRALGIKAPTTLTKLPQKLSDIISLSSSQKIAVKRSSKNSIMEFTPAHGFAQDGDVNAEDQRPPKDGAMEIMTPEGARPLLNSDIESIDEGQPLIAALGQTESDRKRSSIERMAYPPSSLNVGAPSALDSKTAQPEKRWMKPPEGLEDDVQFWKDIYSKYDKNQVVLHHPRYLKIIYGVIDNTDIAKNERLSEVEKKYMRDKRVEEQRKNVIETLKRIALNTPATQLTDEEWEIKKLFKLAPEADALKKAAEDESVRAQTGQRDKFIEGIKSSGRMLGEIENIFSDYEIPREVTRLVFVESMFNLKAVSAVGASGIWQFMPGTGRLYLKINGIEDERNDPIAATHAAAKLLRLNYQKLGNWPLAINAYNAGRGRMQQAIAKLGTTDIGTIIKKFDHPDYAFASRNFFLEFLAALDVAEHWRKYFGDIKMDPPLIYEAVRTTYHISLPDVARKAKIPIEKIEMLNPSFAPDIIDGTTSLPMGFEINVPEGSGRHLLEAATQSSASTRGAIRYRTKEGDTVFSIAAMYGVSAESIRKANPGSRTDLKNGQIIEIPFGM